MNKTDPAHHLASNEAVLPPPNALLVDGEGMGEGGSVPPVKTTTTSPMPSRAATDEKAAAGKFVTRIHAVFPHIPADSARGCANHFVRLGLGEEAATLTDQAVENMVAAHARHCLTGYDGMLRTGVEWGEARRQVVPIVRRRLLGWKYGRDGLCGEIRAKFPAMPREDSAFCARLATEGAVAENAALWTAEAAVRRYILRSCVPNESDGRTREELARRYYRAWRAGAV